MAAGGAFRPALTPSKSAREPKRVEIFNAWLVSAFYRPMALAEITAAMSLLIAVGWAMRPHDPLFLNLGFPWIWLPATLFALRYGALLGTAAGIFIVVGWLVFYRATSGTQFPIMVFAGGFIQVIVAGHFADVWHARRMRARVRNDYLQQRLTALSNNHYLLRVSHDRLEKDAFFGAATLREALNDIRRLCLSGGEDVAFPGVQPLLQFLADTCKITGASLHAVEQLCVADIPLAAVGPPTALETGNPLLQRCMLARTLSHIGGDPESQSTYLACVPVMVASGRMTAILIVRDMAFDALSRSNLELLQALLAYYGGVLEDRQTIIDIQSVDATCPEDFAIEIARLANVARHGAVPSYLMAIRIPDGCEGVMLEQQIENAEAQGASVWRREAAGKFTIIVLHPLILDPHNLEAEWDAHAAAIGARCRMMPITPALRDYGLAHVISGVERNA